MLFFIAFLVVFWVIIWKFLPETKNKTYDDIARLLKIKAVESDVNANSEEMTPMVRAHVYICDIHVDTLGYTCMNFHVS